MVLGLTFCKKIMESHNGSIAVSSKEGKGTTFVLTFPASTNTSQKNSGQVCQSIWRIVRFKCADNGLKRESLWNAPMKKAIVFIKMILRTDAFAAIKMRRDCWLSGIPKAGWWFTFARNAWLSTAMIIFWITQNRGSALPDPVGRGYPGDVPCRSLMVHCWTEDAAGNCFNQRARAPAGGTHSSGGRRSFDMTALNRHPDR